MVSLQQLQFMFHKLHVVISVIPLHFTLIKSEIPIFRDRSRFSLSAKEVGLEVSNGVVKIVQNN
jgi:hypothetical protein